MSAHNKMRGFGLRGATVLSTIAGCLALATGSAAASPTVATEGASTVRAHSVTANGTVNPGGEEITFCQFEYGLGPGEVEGRQNESYGSVAACSPAIPFSGSSPVAVGAELRGLALETTYHYRLVVLGKATGLDLGRNATFTTITVPELQTEAASGVEEPAVGTIDATLNGSLAPDGSETDYYFEYGETEAYGSVSATAGAGKASELVHAQARLTGLKGQTTYHFRIVATNSFGTSRGTDMKFTTPSVVPDLQTEGATSIEQSTPGGISATLNGSLDPEGADTHYYFEYGETEAYGSLSPALPGADVGSASGLVHAQAQLTGLRSATTYHFRIVATNSAGTAKGHDATFTTPVLPPLIGGLPASNVTQFAATLEGMLETGNAAVNYRFEYGTTTAYGQVAPVPDSYASFGSEKVIVSQPVSGLQAGTTYHYRILASSPGATEVKGPDETFTTLPVPAPLASTGASSGIGVGSATLSGTVDPHGWDTSYAFEYGTSTAYGSSWPTVQVDMGALEGAQPVVVGIPNLLPSTTYHYRLVATNGGGTSYGQDMAFTTGEYPAQAIQEPVAFGTLLVPSEPGKVTTSEPKKKKKKTKKKAKKKAKKHGRHKTHPRATRRRVR